MSEIGSLKFTLSADTTEFEAGLESVSTKLKELDAHLVQIQQRVEGLFPRAKVATLTIEGIRDDGIYSGKALKDLVEKISDAAQKGAVVLCSKTK